MGFPVIRTVQLTTQNLTSGQWGVRLTRGPVNGSQKGGSRKPDCPVSGNGMYFLLLSMVNFFVFNDIIHR